MGDQQYIAQGLQHPDGLSGTPSLPDAARSSGAPPTSLYSVLTPYSAVSSFNYPAQCDSTLLTPISSAGSPPLHQGQKLGRQYPPPPSTPQQENTPPESSKMYTQWSQFEMQGQTSQTSSPLTNSAPVAPDFLPHYISGNRRTPGPPEPYLGNFSVSDVEQQPYYVPMASMEQSQGLMMRDAPPLGADAHHSRGLPSTPVLNQPHPSQYRPARRTSVEDTVFHAHNPEASRSMSSSPRGKVTQGNTRVKKRANRRQSASQKSQVPPKDPSEDHKNCYGEEVAPKLKPSCNDIDRLVVDSRWKHRNKRGQDMWQMIQADVQNFSGREFNREDLQMKFRRTRTQIEWHDKDIDLLREAWRLTEADRYNTIHKKFLELGGSRNMYLNSVDIEAKVTSLKLEADLYIPGPKGAGPMRRRQKVTSKKRNNGPSQDELKRQHEDTKVFHIDDAALGLNPHGQMSEEDIVRQIYQHRAPEWSGIPSDELMDAHLANSRSVVKMEPGQQHIGR